ncbi:TetR/AcrR family transcriptional regulator [Antrihabitans cavernicola]|uniref:TetR/AcrR family transcriptional regulator n=1 Tax=Antrihabitans cavernicola TaxID=2495913 RepID=A0A5A7SFF7_9NOCA|nr:TetR/AcrR family transcriptional regulator [Spelaeibacter cavernicola]KAA0024556.1 TetR/AcrR family transcriptional regulator [Spelaeibacter cavernicola]
MSVRDTRTQIREAAIRLITAKGFEQTSLREVAEDVGITKASLYYHYASKADLLAAIVEPVLDHMRSVTDEAVAMPYSDDAMRSVLRHYLSGLMQFRDEGALLLRDTVAIINAIDDKYPAMVADSNRLYAWLAGPDANPEAHLRAIGALHLLGVALSSKELVPTAGDDLVERVLLDAAMAVLGPTAQSTQPA